MVWLLVGVESVYGRRGRPRLGGCAGSVSGATVAGFSRSMLTLSSHWPKSRRKNFGSREITWYGLSYRAVSGVRCPSFRTHTNGQDCSACGM